MAVFYVVGGISIIVVNSDALMPAVKLIFSDAFSAQAVAGGAIGTVIRYGVARGYSPMRRVWVLRRLPPPPRNRPPRPSGFGFHDRYFLDTIVVCSITGIVLVMGLLGAGGEFVKPELSGAALTTVTFKKMLPGIGGWIVTIGLIFFATQPFSAGVITARNARFTSSARSLPPCTASVMFLRLCWEPC